MRADNPERPATEALGGHSLLTDADVSSARERARRSRLSKALLVLLPVFGFLWWRVLTNDPLGLPRLTPRVVEFIPIALLIVMLGGALVIPLAGAGRSPHVLFRPEELDTTFVDVKGCEVVVEEVVKTLNLFLA